MTVTPFSEFFPPDIRYGCPRKALPVFDRIAYLYETIDLRRNQFEKAQITKANEGGWGCGTISLPEHKEQQFGTNEEICKNHWSIFVFCAEFEAYLGTITRFFNLSFYHLNRDFFEFLIREGEFNNKDLEDVNTLGKFFALERKLKKNNSNKQKYLYINPYTEILVKSWNDWGRYISILRNYMEHEASFGGNLFSVAQMTNGKTGYCSIHLPTIESIEKHAFKKIDEKKLLSFIWEDIEKGEYYDSKDFVKDYHPKIKELTAFLFNKETLKKANWLWQE